MPTAAWDFQGQPKYLSLHMNVILRNQNIYQCIYECIMLPKYLSLHMNYHLTKIFSGLVSLNYALILLKKINSKSEYDWQKL